MVVLDEVPPMGAAKTNGREKVIAHRNKGADICMVDEGDELLLGDQEERLRSWVNTYRSWVRLNEPGVLAAVLSWSTGESMLQNEIDQFSNTEKQSQS